MQRPLVIVSGYYGFDNLGDEAILEEVCAELKQLVKAEDVIVLSANPEATAKRFGVRSIQRKSFGQLFSLLGQSCLFVSGGGGLFQNTRSLGSIIFYGLQILMARANNARIMIYAQGIGPLKGRLAENICKQVFAQCHEIALRDDASMRYLASWGLKGERTADPVWKLAEGEPPSAVLQQLEQLDARKENSNCVGVSLRPSPELSENHLQNLADGLAEALKSNETLLLLPLQKDQDLEPLARFEKLWLAKGRKSLILDTSELVLPSQWIGVFARMKLLVGMRLHAIIMTLKSGVPVVGIGYDPKVTQLLAEFEQCCLILTKAEGGRTWPEAIKTAMSSLPSYSCLAQSKSEAAKKLACQNFEILARILNMPREGGN